MKAVSVGIGSPTRLIFYYAPPVMNLFQEMTESLNVLKNFTFRYLFTFINAFHRLCFIANCRCLRESARICTLVFQTYGKIFSWITRFIRHQQPKKTFLVFLKFDRLLFSTFIVFVSFKVVRMIEDIESLMLKLNMFQ